MSASVNLDIEGMTCASCAARIEKKLNRLDGVTATVNFATETAHVDVNGGAVTPAELITVVENLGYRAELPAPMGAASGSEADHRDFDAEEDQWRQRLVVCTILATPVLLMSMIPALQFTNWRWLALTLASPVVVWGAWPFHRAAWLGLRHLTTTMDTLISVGVGAAYLWSLYALFFGDAASGSMSADDVYLEVASVVTVFVVAGRYFERRARRRSGQALRDLLTSAPKRYPWSATESSAAYRSISFRPSNSSWSVRVSALRPTASSSKVRRL